MLASSRRIQLTAPTSATNVPRAAHEKPGAASAAASALGKRPTDAALSSSPMARGPLVKRQLVTATPAEDVGADAHSRMYTPTPRAVGVSVTSDGPEPPNIKKAWAWAKNWDNRERHPGASASAGTVPTELFEDDDEDAAPMSQA